MKAFNKTSIILSILFTSGLFLFNVSAQDGDLVAEGTGLGSNQSEALMNAKRDAVEKGIGMVLLSQTEIENFMLKRDQVITKTMGSVKSYDKLSENNTSDGLIEIKIKAVLSRSTMHEDLAAFHILLESMDKPKVMVIIFESNVGDDQPVNNSAENAIISFLKSPYDFDLVEPGVVARIRSNQTEMAKLQGDGAAAAVIGSKYGAEVIITGKAISRIAEGMSQSLGGMQSVQADITLRAINCATGRIIATGEGHGAKVHISPNTAGTNAISQGATKAVKSLLDAIIEDWNKQLNNGIPLTVSIDGVASFREKNYILQTLQTVPGVAVVHERGWNAESKVLDADIQYKGNANGFCSKMDGYKLKQGGGSFLVSGVTGTRISLQVQVK